MSIWMEHNETDWKDTCADLDVLGEEKIIYVDEIDAVDKVQHTNAITLKFSINSLPCATFLRVNQPSSPSSPTIMMPPHFEQ